MGRNMLIGAALAAVLVGFGVVTGASLLRPDAPAAVAPEPAFLEADAEPTLVGRSEPEKQLEHSLSPQILERLAALEEAVGQMSRQYAEMSKRLDPAIEIIELINSQRSNRGRPRKTSNETAAIATGRNVISAQAQMQATARIDVDSDGTGEYGGFLELSGAVPGRMAKVLVPPVLSSSFRILSGSGEVTRAGYLYCIYLADAKGRPVGEETGGFRAGDIDPDLAETTWCMYAWPIEYGKTGKRTLFVNQAGDVLATDDPDYSGSGNGPLGDAAFKSRGTITGAVALGAEGQDGNLWRQVN